MIKAALFDLDGTLLNTIEDLADSCNKTLRQLNFKEHSLEEVRSFVGNGIARLMELAVPDGKSNKDFEKSVALMKENYSTNWHNKTKAYDGIMELLAALKAKGIKIGINSNKPDTQVKELAALYFSEYVKPETAAGDKDGIRRKPYPDLAEEIMRIMGVEKNETVYIGDSEVDVATARNAGIRCISVTWGFRSKALLKENGAEIFADNPAEVLSIIERL